MLSSKVEAKGKHGKITSIKLTTGQLKNKLILFESKQKKLQIFKFIFDLNLYVSCINEENCFLFLLVQHLTVIYSEARY